ncbi:hypothetical protein CAMRE0001_2565 [Campylobacter rectus RM3267]|uniref:Uncharacterized protein n=1 Tax=Campylobacter rectus RM3267 TaxID=553218 RepID=B9D3U7_CAMRE|nr:hypothetical protein CAMRE0001_2565 [Campylobacter rectus RM3267]
MLFLLKFNPPEFTTAFFKFPTLCRSKQGYKVNLHLQYDPSLNLSSRRRKFNAPKFNIVPSGPTKISIKNLKQNYDKFIKKLRLINLVSIRNTYRLK